MILKGDCIEVMKAMKSNSVDAIVTDPPYGLEFMGKDWDKLWDKREFGIDEYSKKSYTCSNGSTRKTNPVSRKLNNPNYKAGIEAQLWHTQWLIEAYRVLKPGGSMLVMGGTRTSHRLACAIEDSGFIIKDTLMWIYGSGFPKAQELSTLVDAKTLGISMKEVKERREIVGKQKPFGRENRKKMMNGSPFNTSYEDKDCEYNITKPLTPEGEYWDGFKVGGIKPAYEPIIWAVKPPEGSYVDNVLRWGVGAVNVDECRIGVESDDGNKRKATGKMGGSDSCFGVGNKYRPETLNKGRFPANIILDEKAGKMLDEQSGMLKSGGDSGYRKFENSCFKDKSQARFIKGVPSDSGGASRFFYCAKASRGERNAGLEGMEEKAVHWSSGHKNPGSFQAKGTKKEMTNHHPTVKPIKLFEWLIKLVTRESQIILDPFIGSGTTGIAVHNTGRKYVGIEKEEEYIEIATKRTAYWRSRPRQLEII